MNVFTVIVTILVAWTIASVLHFVVNLGNKHRQRGWRNVVDIVLSPPVLVIATIIGRLRN